MIFTSVLLSAIVLGNVLAAPPTSDKRRSSTQLLTDINIIQTYWGQVGASRLLPAMRSNVDIPEPFRSDRITTALHPTLV